MPNQPISINANSYRDVMRKLDRRVKSIAKSKAFEMCKRLAEMGAVVAKVHFDMASMDGNSDIEVVVEKKNGNVGCRIVASGHDVAFAEFGTGITAGNGYEDPPSGIDVTPGSWSQKYGKGNFVQGSHEYWYYGGGKVFGTTPKKGMYYAEKEIKENVKRVAGEVLREW